jgi:hypothetical protein
MSTWRAKALELFPDMRSAIQSAETVGALWVQLMARFARHYRQIAQAETGESPELMRAICLYAVWCTRSKSFAIREPAYIGFFQHMQSVLRIKPQMRKQIISDLVANLGLAELEKQSGEIGYSMKPDEVQRFFADAREAENERQRRMRGR